MNEQQKATPDEFEKTVGDKERRKLRARTEGHSSPWFGLGMFGLIGWSIVAPTLIGILLGRWIDANSPSRVSWTVTLLFLGVTAGAVNAWFWIQRESKG